MRRGTLIAVMVGCLARIASVHSAELVVRVRNIEPKLGELAYALFDSDSGFPTQKERAFRRGFVRIESGPEMTFTISELAPGEYALAVYQDMNGDRKLGKNFLGIPREPAGVSNNPTTILGPPGYRTSKFVLSGDRQELIVNLVN